MDPETDNPDKGQLLQKSAQHRERLEEEVKQITEQTEKMVTNALIIGGALALTYFLVSSLSGGAEKKRSKPGKVIPVRGTAEDESSPGTEYSQPREAGIVSQIGAVLMAQATGFLLSVAREKLMEFLQSQGTQKENKDERS